MLDRLENILIRYRQVQEELSSPVVSADPMGAKPLLKEAKDLLPLVEKIRLYQKVQGEINQARTMETESDPEIRSMAAEEVRLLTDRAAQLEEEIRALLLPKDPDDDKSAILEIRAGTGGEEAALFAGELFRMYTKFAELKRWKFEVVSVSEAEAGGLKEVVCEVQGAGAYGTLKWESGVHRVQRVPTTESQGRVHTSAATVAVLPEADERDVTIRPDDLKIDVYRASGAGGQHVNRTESAVRITHLPTGLVVAIQDERSQIKNRARALKILQSRLLVKTRDEEASKVAASRKSQVGSGDRSEKIRTYNFPQNRLTDHRIDLTLYKLDRIMEGEIDDIIEALQLADRAEKLHQETEVALK
ncbi:peptide chain release factor 1 [candidate division KSB1 bacterium]|nr:peptide chain release factor 1 [candidate division KSB1 bacterium]